MNNIYKIDIDLVLKAALNAAEKAGKTLKEGFGTSFKISNKEGKNNLVTEYDNLSEKIIIETLKSEFPDSCFLAEESGKSGEKSEESLRWIIDPLDGTVNFAHSLPLFCVSIAAEYKNELICGVVYQPILGEMFYASKGKGAYLNGEPIKVSKTDDMDKSMLVTGFPYNVNENPLNCIDHFVNIIKRGIPVRRLGSAAIDIVWVANGRFDGFWEVNLHPWDVAAAVLIVREAGGMVTQFDMQEYNIDNKTILATNGKIHEQISKTLTEIQELK